MSKQYYKLSIFHALILFAASCNTTRKIPDGEFLYTGVKKIEVASTGGEKIPAEVVTHIKEPLSVAPNNPLISPYVRWPFPVGLWAYNRIDTTKGKGVKYWIYNKLAKDPVLLSKVQPDLRLKVAGNILDNYGYFNSASHYELLYSKKDSKKVRVNYRVNVSTPAYTYSNITYPGPTDSVTIIIDSLQSSSLLWVGGQYNIDTLTAELNRIERVLRNKGYYYFRSEYLEYQADTTGVDCKVDLRLMMKQGIPSAALKKYNVGNIYVSLQNYLPGAPDTIDYCGMQIAHHRKLKIRRRVLADCITLRPETLFTLDNQNKTLSNLTRLGIFRYVNLGVSPLDSLKGSDVLDVYIDAGFDMQIETEFEVNVSSKSNSFLGPGASYSVSNKNLFKGGEIISARVKGAYEWQTGSRNSETHSSLLNSYEIGGDVSLSFPRMLAPKFVPRSKKYPHRTTFQVGTDLLNRPKYFRMVSFSSSMRYDVQGSRNSFHTLTPAKIVYNKLLHTTAVFDSTMSANPAVAMSFRDQLIPSMNYTYIFDRSFGYRKGRRLYWQNSFSQAGNILWGAMAACGVNGTKHIFGNQFSQFIKETSEVKYFHRIGMNSWIASRFLVGVGYAYGNSSVMPYSEQFYIGGANSIRAFTVRSVGPGSYRAEARSKNAYIDQTGNFKLEANVEYRFKIVSLLHGATFLDIGNIWLLSDDPLRPGSGIASGGFFDKIAVGTGCGLRFDVDYLVVRFDWGVGIHAPYTNTVRKGYYNIDRFRDGMGIHLAIGYPF